MTRGEALRWGAGDTRRIPQPDVPAEVLALVTERMGGRYCPDCQAVGLVTPQDVPLELDHVQPVARGGDNHHLNLRWACRSHNRARGARPVPREPGAPRWARRKAT